MGQLRRQLGPSFKKLGVRPKFETDETCGGQILRFERPDGRMFSPVWISIPNPESESWEGCTLSVDQWKKYDAGHNGWAFYRPPEWTTDEPLEADLDATFRRIRWALDKAGTILKGEGHLKKTDNEFLAYTFVVLDEELCSNDEIYIKCKREKGIESLNFVDQCDRSWKITFQEGKATIQLEGEELAVVPWDDPYEISVLIRMNLFDATVTRDAGI
jgi:hypothetical protein